MSIDLSMYSSLLIPTNLHFYIFIIFSFIFYHIYLDAPNCTITRKEEDGEDTLICAADGNPEDYQYEWDFKSDNESEADKNFNIGTRNKKSYLLLGDVPQKRVYVCRANNTVGLGSQCEISVEGKHCLYSFTGFFLSSSVYSRPHTYLLFPFLRCFDEMKRSYLNVIFF